LIHQKTVLVLGAGASWPYGFPTGQGLIKNILDGTRETSQHFWATLRDAGVDDDLIRAFHRTLARTQFDSIDIFLEYQPEYREVGKLAIAAALIPCEREENLANPPIEGRHWYKFLFQRLMQRDGFTGSKLSIISLNYDRSLQQYLYQTLIQDLRKTPDARPVQSSASSSHTYTVI